MPQFAGKDIDVRAQPDGTFQAVVRGDQSKPRLVGTGTTWQEASRDLQQKINEVRKQRKGR